MSCLDIFFIKNLSKDLFLCVVFKVPRTNFIVRHFLTEFISHMKIKIILTFILLSLINSFSLFKSGSHLLSHAVSSIVPSAV